MNKRDRLTETQRERERWVRVRGQIKRGQKEMERKGKGGREGGRVGWGGGGARERER